VEILAVILRRGRSGGAPFHLALAAFVSALGGEELPYELRRDLYGLSKERGRDDLAQLFFSAISPPATIDEKRAQALQREGRPLTLGERKQLARGGTRELIDRLLRDPDPSVIRLLLANPKLREADVIVIGSRRPQNPDVQREIFASRLWIAAYHVKRTLALNPSTPSDLAVRLLGFLQDADLRLVASSTELPPVVQSGARTLLSASKNPVGGD
jgi:hypothetical protein